MKIKTYKDAIANLEDQKATLKQMLFHMEAIERIVSDFNTWARVEFSDYEMTDENWAGYDKYLGGEPQ